MPKPLKDTLDEYFEFAREKNVPEVPAKSNNAAEAEFLGVSPPLLSRIKTGKSRLIDAKLKQFADRLSGGDGELRERIERELILSRDALLDETLQASSPAAKLVKDIRDLFQRLSNSQSFICVDYRDLAQADEKGEYSILAEEAAKAIANGLDFGMFQVYGTVEAQKEDLIKMMRNDEPTELRAYLLKLAKKVRASYKHIKTMAEKSVEARERKGRLVLYEAKHLTHLTACGISSRMFYVNYFDESTGRRDSQIFQWVSGRDDDDHFIRRDSVSVEPEAFAQQFHPVVEYWSKAGMLPSDEHSLADAYKMFSGKAKGQKSPDGFEWQIYSID